MYTVVNNILNNNLYTTLSASILYIILLYIYNKYNKIEENLHSYVKSFILVNIVILIIIN